MRNILGRGRRREEWLCNLLSKNFFFNERDTINNLRRTTGLKQRPSMVNQNNDLPRYSRQRELHFQVIV